MWHDHPPYLLVAWSLSIEEWFYLVTALGISLLTRWFAPTRALLVTLILLLVVPTILRSYVALSTTLSWNDVLRQYVPLRLDVIGTGVAMVWWWRTWVHTHPMRAGQLAVLSTVLSVAYLGLLAWFQPDVERDAWVRVTLISSDSAGPRIVVSVACSADAHTALVVRALGAVDRLDFVSTLPAALPVAFDARGVGRSDWAQLAC
jgi:peptidoglycan/LPS O-acetylase OafA/YrhL